MKTFCHAVGMFCLMVSALFGSSPVLYRVMEVGGGYSGSLSVGHEFLYSGENGSTKDYSGLEVWERGDGFQTVHFIDGLFSYGFGGFNWNGVLINSRAGFNSEDWFRVEPVFPPPPPPPSPSISGTVSTNGVGVSGALIRVFADRGFWWEPVGGDDYIFTDSSGFYAVTNLSSGSYLVCCSSADLSAMWSDRYYTGLVHVASADVSGIDFSWGSGLIVSGEFTGLFNIPATNVMVSVWRRSLPKTYGEPYWVELPASSILPFDGYYARDQLADGAWWWSVTPASVPLTDHEGRWAVSGLDSGWYIFRFEGGNLSEPFEVERYVTSSFEINRRVVLEGVSIDNPPLGVFVIREFHPFVPSTTWPSGLAHRVLMIGLKTNTDYSYYFSEDLKTWVLYRTLRNRNTTSSWLSLNPEITFGWSRCFLKVVEGAP